jgi:hypothetical protein
METGQRGATLRDVRDLCDLYGVTGEDERQRLMGLAREGKQQGWWQSFGLPYSTFVGLEQDASSMKIYYSAVVPGILQMGDYLRALHRVAVPRPDAATIELRVEERLRRGQLLTRSNPPQLEVVIDEAVLRRPVGGPAAMGAQLSHILKVAELSNITIQVIPFAAGAHPALESDFVILSFDGWTSDIVHIEGLVGQVFLEKTPDVERYFQVFDSLQDMALSPKDSAHLIAGIRDAYVDARAAG